MAIEVHALHPHVGAEVRGLDLSQPLADAAFATITAAFNRHAVLVFPNQALADAEQIAFSARFGPIEPVQNYTRIENQRLEGQISDLSNIDPDGNIWGQDSKRRFFNLGNQLWHTDSSFKRIPALCSLLSLRGDPPLEGGETEFADLRAAYDALPPARQVELSAWRLPEPRRASALPGRPACPGRARAGRGSARR